MLCYVCETTKDEDFILHHNDTLCDDCLAIFNYHYREMFIELKEDAARRHEPESFEVDEASFIEALNNFAAQKCEEYNDHIRKHIRKEIRNGCNL